MALGFLGAGNMGEAMIRGLLSAKLRSPEQVVVYDAAPGRGEELRRRFGVVAARSVGDLLRACDTVVVAVKPQVLPSVLSGISRDAARGKTFVSIVAGAKIALFEKALGEGARIVRTMPNTPAQIGMGSTGIYFPPVVDAATRQEVLALFSSFGTVAEMPREELLDAVTEPVLSRLRRKLPLFAGSIDFAPMVAVLVIVFLQRFVVRTLFDLALRMP